MKHKLLYILLLLPLLSYGQGTQYAGSPGQLNGWYGGVTADRFFRLPQSLYNMPWFDSCGRVYFDKTTSKAIYFNDCGHWVQILSKNDTAFIKQFASVPDSSVFATINYVINYVATHGGNVDSSIYATRYWVLGQGYIKSVDSSLFATQYWVAQQLAGYYKKSHIDSIQLPKYNPNYLFQIRSEYPVIPFTAGEYHSQYYPSTIRLHGAEIWCYTKGDNLQSISSDKSTNNGSSFTYSKFALTPNRTTGVFDNYQVTTPTAYYDSTENADSIYLFYTGVDSTFINYGIGIAATDTAHPDTFTRLQTTPILSYQDIQNAGWCIRALNVNCSQVFRYNGLHYMYIYYLDSVTNNYNICLAHSQYLSHGWTLDKIIYRPKAPYTWAWRLQAFKFDDDSLFYYGRVTLVTPIGINGRIISLYARNPIDTFYDLTGPAMETREDTGKFDYNRLYQGAFTLRNDGSLHLDISIDSATQQKYALYFYSGSSNIYQPGGVRYDRAGLAKMFFQNGIDSFNRYMREDLPIDITSAVRLRGQNASFMIDYGTLQSVPNNNFYFPVFYAQNPQGLMMSATQSQVITALNVYQKPQVDSDIKAQINDTMQARNPISYADTGAGKHIETIYHAASTYQPKGSYLTTETDPVWVSDSVHYLLKSDSVPGGYYPYSSNPLGYLTSFTESDPVYTANGLKKSDTTTLSVTQAQLNDSLVSFLHLGGNYNTYRGAFGMPLPFADTLLAGMNTKYIFDSTGKITAITYLTPTFYGIATANGGPLHPYPSASNPALLDLEGNGYVNTAFGVQLGAITEFYIGDSNSTYKYATMWKMSVATGTFRNIVKFMSYPTVNVNVNDVLIQDGYGSNVTLNTLMGNPSPSYNLPAKLYVANTATASKKIMVLRFNAGQTGDALDITDSVNVYSVLYPYGKAYFTDTLGVKNRSGTWKAFSDTLGDVVGVKIIKSGGTSSQFLKADGSIDANTYLTGNQSITLSGDVSGTGTTSITTSIGAGKVTNTMLAGSIDLTTKVTGILPVANGGTGVNNFPYININTQTGTTYTIASADNGKVITLNNASAITVTVPSGLGSGFNCALVQLGAGQVTISAGSGVTIHNSNSYTKTRAQYSYMSLAAYAADTYVSAGDGQ